jgi:hypothetical protein
VLSLWLLEIASLVMLGGGIWMLFGAPEKRLVAFAGIVLFGTGAVLFAIQLLRRYRPPAVDALIDPRSSK